MATLTLDPEHVASERQVILEEIAMYDSEPWDALEMAVHELPVRRASLWPARCWAPARSCWPRARRTCAPSTAASTGRTTPSWSWPEITADAHRRHGGAHARPGCRAGAERRAGRTVPTTVPAVAGAAGAAQGRGGADAPRAAGAAGRSPGSSGPAAADHAARRRPDQPPPPRPGGRGAALRPGWRPTSRRGWTPAR